MAPTVHLIMGTRPEAVKLAPLAAALRREGVLRPLLVATGQHPSMVVQALAAFGESPDVTLQINRTTGQQAEFLAECCPLLDQLLVSRGSSAVVVQGDTASALVGGLLGFWRGIPLVHLEAGLRSGDLRAPFPEEANRRMVGVIADLHLAPTKRAVASLVVERVPRERIVLVGNTVVDAVLEMSKRRVPLADPRLVEIDQLVSAGRARLLLVTAHRRESWGAPLERVLTAVDQIVREHPEVHCVLPAHPNPAVRAQVDAALSQTPRTVVTDPLAYPVLCRLLCRSSLVLTDSGGIQEEAPTFRVPVLVLRDVTERMEAVQAGWARLVGTDTARIVEAAARALNDRLALPTTGNPFGDGHAAARSARAIAWLLGYGRPPSEFVPPLVDEQWRTTADAASEKLVPGRVGS